MIHARLLGSIMLDLGGRPAPQALLWRKHLALCLLLWHAAERRLPRDRALALLWGDRAEREARHSLNEALRVIRRAVGDAAIGTDRDWLAWHAELSLDTEAFVAGEQGDPSVACDLIAGDWCEGFTVPGAPECERWLEDERRWWRTRLVAALVRGAAEAEGRGDIARALLLATRGRRLDPLAEAPARSVIRAQFLAGDRSGALETGRELVRQLADELGAGPDAETSELLQAITDGGSRRRDRAMADPVESLRAPLVGRAAVMQEVTRRLGGCFLAPRSAMVVVEGERGAGRTRIAEEAVARAAADGASVLVLRAVPADGESPAAGLRALAAIALRHAPGAAAVPPAAMRTLVAMVPAWAEQFVATPGEAAPLATALATVLRTAAVERPLLVVIDDADDLDDATLAAIPELLRSTADLPVMLLLTTASSSPRPAVDQLVGHLDREERGVLLRLEPLDGPALLTSVAAAIPQWDEAARDRLVRRLLADSAGLPGLAFPVLSAVAAGLDLDDAPWPAADRTYDATLPSRLPGSLVAAVRLRFHRLRTPAQKVLAAVSVRTGIASPAGISQATGIAIAEVEEILDGLESARWLVSDDRGYQVRARTIGAMVATEMITPGVRRRLLRSREAPGGA